MTSFAAGQTGLIAPVPAVEELVGRHRAAHDSSAGSGVPAHVTVVFPFVPLREVDARVRETLRDLCAARDRFEVTFRRVGRFPGVAWLAPEPDDPFRALTAAVVADWPAYQPYEGAFDDVLPHLTVAEGDDEVLDAAERAVRPGLPVRAFIEELELLGFDGSRWSSVARFPLGSGGQASMDDMSP